MNKQPEALRIADQLEDAGIPAWMAEEAADELRRLHVHNAELENSLIKKSIALQKIWKERDELRKRQVADEALLRKALAQLEINRTNFYKAPSKSICKMLAGGNDEVITALKEILK